MLLAVRHQVHRRITGITQRFDVRRFMAPRTWKERINTRGRRDNQRDITAGKARQRRTDQALGLGLIPLRGDGRTIRCCFRPELECQ